MKAIRKAIRKSIPSDFFKEIFDELTDNYEGKFSKDFANGKYKLHISVYPNTYYTTEIGKIYCIDLMSKEAEYTICRETTDKELYDYMGNKLSDINDYSEIIYTTNNLSNLESFNNLEPGELEEFIRGVVSRCTEVIKETPAYWESKKKNLMESI